MSIYYVINSYTMEIEYEGTLAECNAYVGYDYDIYDIQFAYSDEDDEYWQ